jgi:hypothetical protein
MLGELVLTRQLIDIGRQFDVSAFAARSGRNADVTRFTGFQVDCWTESKATFRMNLAEHDLAAAERTLGFGWHSSSPSN